MVGSDQAVAARLDRARERLRGEFDAELADRPWLGRGMAGTDGDLVRLVAWCARRPDVERDVVLAGVSLLGSARAELDQIEAGLLFAARAAGVTWSDVAAALGLGSAQAAHQRFERVVARTDEVEG